MEGELRGTNRHHVLPQSRFKRGASRSERDKDNVVWLCRQFHADLHALFENATLDEIEHVLNTLHYGGVQWTRRQYLVLVDAIIGRKPRVTLVGEEYDVYLARAPDEPFFRCAGQREAHERLFGGFDAFRSMVLLRLVCSPGEHYAHRDIERLRDRLSDDGFYELIAPHASYRWTRDEIEGLWIWYHEIRSIPMRVAA